MVNKARLNGTSLMFECPGCKHLHVVKIDQWTWNNNLELPTITPSILVSWDWRTRGKIEPYCHSFVTDGKIQFLGDCKHELVGQTVDLPDLVDD